MRTGAESPDKQIAAALRCLVVNPARIQNEAQASSTAFIGCAGWNIPAAEQPRFPGEGSHLERYASRLSAVEINSSFYRPHRPSTYARWADTVPDGFRFSVKAPKEITHTRRLVQCDGPIATFLEEAGALGDKLGCLLVQLPPSLQLDLPVARSFFEGLRSRTSVPIACEPRHASWFTPEADALLREFHAAGVAADPAKHCGGANPRGWRGFSYYRLHGSPKIYYSTYSLEYLEALSEKVRADLAAERTVWCIFDNTASGAAAANALDLIGLLSQESARPR